jgi:hypothetical protein
MDVIEKYEPYFAGQLIEHWNLAQALEREWGSKTQHLLCEGHELFDKTICSGKLFADLLNGSFAGSGVDPTTCSRHVAVSGVLYHHMDMWVNPTKLLAYDKEKVWFPEKGLGDRPTVCYEGYDLEKDTQWNYWEDSKTTGRRAVAQLMASQDAPTHWRVDQICRGHADIFYVPLRMMSFFSRASKHFADVFHEVSNPTLLHIAAEETHTKYIPTLCNGSCCEVVKGDLTQMTCGHKVNLEKKYVREKIKQLLKDNVPVLDARSTA